MMPIAQRVCHRSVLLPQSDTSWKKKAKEESERSLSHEWILVIRAIGLLSAGAMAIAVVVATITAVAIAIAATVAAALSAVASA